MRELSFVRKDMEVLEDPDAVVRLCRCSECDGYSDECMLGKGCVDPRQTGCECPYMCGTGGKKLMFRSHGNFYEEAIDIPFETDLNPYELKEFILKTKAPELQPLKNKLKEFIEGYNEDIKLDEAKRWVFVEDV